MLTALYMYYILIASLRMLQCWKYAVEGNFDEHNLAACLLACVIYGALWPFITPVALFAEVFIIDDEQSHIL